MNEQLICCVCNKIIKNDKFNYIGKNFVGLELYQHNKCKLYHLSKEQLNKLKNCKEIKLKEK